MPLANTRVGTQITFETFLAFMSLLVNFEGIAIGERLAAHFTV